MHIFVFATLMVNPADYDPDTLRTLQVNPFDVSAINEAIRLKNKFDDSSVTVAFVGPSDIEPIVRKLISGEVDTAVHLCVEEELFENADGFTIATALGNFLNDKDYDLVLFGKPPEGLISGLAQITAEMVNVPCVAGCKSIDVRGEEIYLERLSDFGSETILTHLPCVVELDSDAGAPVRSSLIGMLKAHLKRVSVENAVTVDPKIKLVKLEELPKRKKRFINRDELPILVRILKEDEKVM